MSSSVWFVWLKKASWKVIPPVDDNCAVFSKAVASLRPVSLMYTVDRHLVHDRQETTCSVMQEKCPVKLICRFGVVIVDDESTWGHVRQTVSLQGKVPGDCCGRFRGRLLLTSRSLRFLALLKAFSGALLKIFLVVLSSRRIRKFLEMIQFSATRLLGWMVVTKGTPGYQ